ncbi:replication initiation protein [Vibrio metschnikovii]|uniref:Replication initiation protein RepB n=1 Tax=Vibrio sp. 0908 TaxID=452802 RepID=A9M4V2_9VIBR|nr:MULTISPECIES: replication initiation protein [Vibrio]ABX77072.1 Replication initiation protein RepB [Vibrio sp. 0908]EKO3663289.1 replication initiation protein [Vibrio metschnikovii]TOP71796.1 replication initiation protein [Vibrio parahaemolyticus]
MNDNEVTDLTAQQKERTITSAVSADIHSDFFKKSHALVFSRLSLSPVEHDIFALLLSRLHKDQWEDFMAGKTPMSPSYEFKSKVLCDWFCVEKEDLYNILYKPSERLAGKKIGVTQEGNSFDFIPLFKRVKYQNGTLTIKPNDELITEYLGISQGHAQIPHKSFRKIKTEHGKRLYTMLCRFKSPHTELHPQTIEDLHGFFGLLDKKGTLLKKTYAVNANFIKRIIKPAIQEIDDKEPSICFLIDEKTGNYGFSYIKEGRKVVGLKFLFQWKLPEKREESKKELTYEDALRTFEDIVDKRCIPSIEEIENLKANLVKIGTEGYEIESGFFTKLREFEDAARDLDA